MYAEGLQSSIPIDVQRLVLATLPGRALVSFAHSFLFFRLTFFGCVTVSRLWSRILLAPPFLHRWRFTCQLCKHLLPFSANGKEDCIPHPSDHVFLTIPSGWFHPKEPRWEIDYYDGGKYFVHWECCGRKNPNDPGCQTRPHSRFIVPWPPYFQLLDANTIHRIVSFMDYWAVGTFSGYVRPPSAKHAARLFNSHGSRFFWLSLKGWEMVHTIHSLWLHVASFHATMLSGWRTCRP